MYTKFTMRWYEVTQNSDTTEGRGTQHTVWQGSDIKRAMRAWQAAEGVFGTDQQKYILQISLTQDENGDMKMIRRKVFGLQWDWDNPGRGHFLTWEKGFEHLALAVVE
jgi:hypothetical protein